MTRAREYNFDCLVGPTHHYAGLSYGNLASTAHRGMPGNPRAAALEGLEKMRFVASLGIGQAVLPPQLRPDIATLRRLGFSGSAPEVIVRAAKEAPELLSMCSSASAMWAANAATVSPSSDTLDGRMHITPANLITLFHRSLEVERTTRVLRAIFADATRFVVHDPLPASPAMSDEGAANHTRLFSGQAALQVFGWGRAATDTSGPERFPARQSREASAAIVRLHQLNHAQVELAQQDPQGIDGGAFHTDVLAVGNAAFLMLHERAFSDWEALIAKLRARLGPEFHYCLARESELSVRDAVLAYPFNSQLVSLPRGGMAIIAPTESEQNPAARQFLERVLQEDNPVRAVHYVNVNGSMKNGGGPACLRLRVTLTDAERSAIAARVFLDDQLYADLRDWINEHYRDRISVDDLADPELLAETKRALEALSLILRLPDLALE